MQLLIGWRLSTKVLASAARLHTLATSEYQTKWPSTVRVCQESFTDRQASLFSTLQVLPSIGLLSLKSGNGQVSGPLRGPRLARMSSCRRPQYPSPARLLTIRSKAIHSQRASLEDHRRRASGRAERERCHQSKLQGRKRRLQRQASHPHRQFKLC
jgi:hypothetical protein